MEIKWDDKLYSIKIPSVDAQHREIFEIAEGIEKIQPDYDPVNLLLLLRRLYSYTYYHFSTEEDLFAHYNYPDKDAHIRLHDAFTKTIKQKFLMLKSGFSPDPEELLNFLAEWIETHIKREDRRYSEYFLKHGHRINSDYASAQGKNEIDNIKSRAVDLWDAKKLALNIREIDNQHKELVYILIQVSDLNKTGVSLKRVQIQLPILIKKLFYYSQFHFGTEESLMRECNYPELQKQIKLHLEFTGEVKKFAINFKTRDANLTDDVFLFLKNWIINHILDEDTKLKHYLDSGKN